MTIEIPGGRGNSMYILGGIGIVVVWSSTALRVYVRACFLRSWGWDDSLMAISAACFTTMAGSIFVLAENDFGKTATMFPVDTLVKLYQATLVGELGYVLTAMVFRLGVCCFYLRLTPVPWHIWTIRILMLIQTVYSIAYFLVLLNQCTPVSFFWTHLQGDTNGHCLSSSVIIGTTYAHNTVSALEDWILNSLPLFIIIPSKMARRTKISALLILCLGSVGSVAIVVRFIALTTITASTSAIPLAPAVAFWSALEACVAILAANIATYRPLLRSIAKSVRSGDNSGTQRSTSGNSPIINLSRIRWPVSGRSSGRRHPRTGYILSEDADTQDLSAWEHDSTQHTTESSPTKVASQVIRTGSEEELHQKPQIMDV